ncbi:MAG: hypothetical protein ACRDJW_25445 [Thermomicrobiales bacterium]
MSDQPASTRTVARVKTRDICYRFRGYWSEGGICRLRLYEGPGLIPVIVCTELEENTNTSVTNLAEVLAAAVIAAWLPDRFEAAETVIWLEHYPGRRDPRRNITGRAEVDRVSFASWTLRRCFMGGVARRKLGEPSWQPLTAEEVAALIGAEALEV